MATQSHIMPAHAGQSFVPLFDESTIPAAFDVMFAALTEAADEEDALDHRYYGDPACDAFFASAGAGWSRVAELAADITRLVSTGPRDERLQIIAASIVTALSDDRPVAVRTATADAVPGKCAA